LKEDQRSKYVIFGALLVLLPIEYMTYIGHPFGKIIKSATEIKYGKVKSLHLRKEVTKVGSKSGY